MAQPTNLLACIPRWQQQPGVHDAGVVIQQPRPPSFLFLTSSSRLHWQEAGQQLGSSKVEVDQGLVHLLRGLDCRGPYWHVGGDLPQDGVN